MRSVVFIVAALALSACSSYSLHTADDRHVEGITPAQGHFSDRFPSIGSAKIIDLAYVSFDQKILVLDDIEKNGSLNYIIKGDVDGKQSSIPVVRCTQAQVILGHCTKVDMHKGEWKRNAMVGPYVRKVAKMGFSIVDVILLKYAAIEKDFFAETKTEAETFLRPPPPPKVARSIPLRKLTTNKAGRVVTSKEKPGLSKKDKALLAKLPYDADHSIPKDEQLELLYAGLYKSYSGVRPLNKVKQREPELLPEAKARISGEELPVRTDAPFTIQLQ